MDKIDLTEMERLLREIGHGFVPVIKVLVKACDSESGKYVHYGVTTQDILDTGLILQIRDAWGLVVQRLRGIRDSAISRRRCARCCRRLPLLLLPLLLLRAAAGPHS